MQPARAQPGPAAAARAARQVARAARRAQPEAAAARELRVQGQEAVAEPPAAEAVQGAVKLSIPQQPAQTSKRPV